jgi:hypothetical protein
MTDHAETTAHAVNDWLTSVQLTPEHSWPKAHKIH